MPEQASRDAKFDRYFITCLGAGLILLIGLLLLAQFGPDWLLAWP
jgi:hypothetical protein